VVRLLAMMHHRPHLHPEAKVVRKIGSGQDGGKIMMIIVGLAVARRAAEGAMTMTTMTATATVAKGEQEALGIIQGIGIGVMMKGL